MTPTAFVAPNLWSLSGGGIHVRYWTFTLGPIRQGDEPPHFTYHDSYRTLSFHGNEIRSVNVPDLGTLVTVTLILTVDTGSTTFTALLPRVNIVSDGPSTSVPVSTEGVRTVHAGPLGPAFAHGQEEFYTLMSHDADSRARCARGRLIAQRA
jgi:hypothetical protein